MLLTLFKSKIHRATVTGSALHYEGSITIDPLLLEAAGLLPWEQVDVLDIHNGSRFTTYIIAGHTPGNGEITVNGAAARLVQKGDLVIVCAYVQLTPEEARTHQPVVVQVDERNRVKRG